ncbi:TniB family NTP-binding protein [Nitrosophilus labii]|uniref:TniB family NTP-binding protein n=1 Tax=Nitrosophilus labii TaxID=2706014 RepID=UPI0016568FB6|nr:TniB family NTP-binding protein [Nitrosophilus labii]
MTQKEYLGELPEKTRKVLKCGKKERIEFIKKPKFIRHPKALKLFKKLTDLMNEPKKDRIRSILLVGDSNNGKTAMVKKFYEMNVYKNDDEMLFFEHVMLIQAPNRADLHDLYNKMFQFFVVPYRKDEPISERENKIKHYCEVNQVRMIIIDEIQGALIGSITKQMEFMNGIKNLSNILKIPIVLVGTPKGVSLVSSDHQLKSRFVPTKIKKWEYDEDYLSLLYAIEMTLPLKKPSLIYENERLAKEILELSDGLIGDIVTICELLAIEAIESGKEKIDKKMLKEIEYVPAYDREGVIYADEI